MTVHAAVIAAVLSFSTSVAAEDPAAIVKKLPNDEAECHYVLSLCSDANRAAETLERIQAEKRGGDADHATRIADAERRVEMRVDLLARAAAAVRARHSAEPQCFRHCTRLRESAH